MPDYSAGSASIKLSPSFTNFVRDSRAELKAMNLTADVQLKLQKADAETQLQTFAREDHSTDLRVNLNDGDANIALEELTRARIAEIEARIQAKESAQADLAEVSRARIAEITARIIAKDAAVANLDEVSKARVAAIEAKAAGVVEVQAQLAELARTRTARVQAVLDKSSTSSAKNDFGKIVGDLKSVGTMSLKITGVVGAAGVISQILAIGEAAAQAAHLVALIPAGGFAAAAGIGSVAAGVSGIPTVFKDLKSASEDPVATATKQRDALNAVSDAEYNVAQSNQKLNDAEKEASRSVRDMNNQLLDQKFAVEDAALSVADAAKNLTKVNFDPTSDATTRQRALLQYQEAVQKQKEAGQKLSDQAQDTATANAKGVSGSPQVVDAIHAQTVAQQELAKAQAAATAASGSGSKVAAALAKLSPNAKELVNDIKGLGPAWHDAQQGAQDALTSGLGPAVQHLADVQLPAVKAGMIGIDAAINSGLKGSLAALSSAGGKADLKTALDNTSTGFANASKAAVPLTDAISKLIAVGSQDLPGFGTAVANIATKFNDLIQRTSADGSLKKGIDDGVTSAKELAQTAEHIGSAIGSVLKAAGNNGQVLKAIDDLTSHMAAFLKSTQGQKDLSDFFTTARGDLDKITPIFKDLPGLLSGVYGAFRTWSEITLPFLKTAADLLSAHPGLVKDIIVAYLAFKTVGPILDGVKTGWKTISDTVDSFKTKLGDAKTATAGVGTQAAVTAGEEGVGKLSGAVGGLGKILSAAGPLGIGALTAGIGIGLDYLVSKHQAAAQAAQEQQQRVEALGQTLDAQTGTATTATLSTVSGQLEKSGDLKRAQQLGVNTNDLVRAASGLDPTSKDAINSRLTQIIQGSSNAQFRNAQGYTGLTDQQIAQALQGVPAAVKAYTDALPAAQQAATQNHTHVDDLAQLKKSLGDDAQAAATLGGELNNTNSAMSQAAEAAKRQNEAVNGLFQLTQQGTQDFADLKTAIVNVPDAKTVVVKALTQDQQAALEKLGDTVTKLPDGTIKIDLSDQQAEADIQKITTAPYTATVKVQVDYSSFTQSLSVGTLKALHGDTTPPGRADGGPVYGPGTDSSDSILMRLSTGEFVVNADAVKKYGMPLLDSINSETFTLPSAQSVVPTAVAAPATAVPSTLAPVVPGAPSSGLPVVNPQVPLPTPQGDAQLQVTQDRAAVDAANSERNAVYANPASTAQDKLASDLAYDKAANSLGNSEQQLGSGAGGAATLLSAQGAGQALGIGLGSVIGAGIGASIGTGQGQVGNAEFGGAFGSKYGGELGQILGGGVLGFFGLDNSILSSTNSWNNALQKGVAAAGIGGPGNTLGYLYQPQNAPSVPGSTTSLPESTPGSAGSPSSNAGTVNPDLGTIGTVSVSPGVSYSPSAGAEQWRPLAAAILQKEGFPPSEANINTMLAQITTESGGNPQAINLTDSNAKAGHPSQGILQTIPSTFEANRDQSLPDDINDPAANMAAALRYYRANYGNDLSTEWGHGHGYADGGLVTGPGGPKSDSIKALLSGGEFVVNAHATQRNLPMLDAINSSTWNPVGMSQMGTAAGAGGTRSVVNRDHSVQYNGPTYVMDPSELVRQQDRWVEQQSMGALAAYA